MKNYLRGRMKFVVVAGAAAALLGSAAAFAYFSTTGTGTGSGQAGHATKLTIKEIGAGYDSLVSSNSYTQDQCFQCAGITELGNTVTLGATGSQELSTVVVGMDNWGTAVATLPVTITIKTTVSGPISDTQDFSFPAATGGATPTETNITFNFASQGAYVAHTFLYGITYPQTDGGTKLNVALSSASYDTSVGSNATPGKIWVRGTYSTLGNDFPSCSDQTVTTYTAVTTACGTQSTTNPGAYGTTTGNANIPAVEFNVVGGTVPTLYPGGPAEPVGFAIVNKGQTAEHVNQITTAVTGTSTGTCTKGTFTVSRSPATYGGNVQPGTTLFNDTGTSVSMLTSGSTQDGCEGATITLAFSSN